MGDVALRLVVPHEEYLAVEFHVQDRRAEVLAVLDTDHYKLCTLHHAAEVQGVHPWM